MSQSIFAVRDNTAEYFERPFYARTKGEAIRSFTQAVQSSPNDSVLAAHPEQFGLYYLGLYDEQEGLIKALDAPELMGLGTDFKNQ